MSALQIKNIEDIFMKLYVNIKPHQKISREQETYLIVISKGVNPCVKFSYRMYVYFRTLLLLMVFSPNLNKI